MGGRFLVKTDHGDVVVVVNRAAGGLAPDLIELEVPDEKNTEGIDFEVPLRAFGAKMVDIIEGAGTSETGMSPRLRDLMVREKATSELKRIERFARDRAGRER